MPHQIQHTFFVTEVNEVDFCGSKVYQLTGSEYSKPADFIRLNYPQHNLNNCNNCKIAYLELLPKMELKHKKFPNCCEPHRKLLKAKWFNLSDFENYPKLYANKLFYTWHHIIHFIESKNWRLEIFDFIEHIVKSFGSFPTEYGEPLYFRQFTEELKSLMSGLEDCDDKKSEIFNYINSFTEPKKENKTDFNVLLGVYNEWFKTFPFELSYFSHLKEYFAKNIPLMKEIRTNKYTQLTAATPKSKQDLINTLIGITNKIIVEINTATLYESGLITDLEKIKMELLIQKRKQKLKEGYINNSIDPNARYRKILKDWLRDEISFIKDIERAYKNVGNNKRNLYNDLLNACCKMQENKIFWDADENTRTKQILDLLSTNYFTKDQSTYGISEKGKKQGSVDGVIIDKSETEHFIEAFNLGSLNKEIIQRHINKVELNYDSKGLLTKFLLVYCNLEDSKFHKIISGYKEFIDNEMNFKFVKNKASELIETNYTNIRVLKSMHSRENSEVSLYHILIKMPLRKS